MNEVKPETKTEVKLKNCQMCNSVVAEPRMTCKRCLYKNYDRAMSDVLANHLCALVFNKYGLDITMFEQITDRTAMKSVEDELDAWADEHHWKFRIHFDEEMTVCGLWVNVKDGKFVIGDVVKVNKKYYLRRGKMRRDTFDRAKGRVIAKIRVFNLWVKGAF